MPISDSSLQAGMPVGDVLVSPAPAQAVMNAVRRVSELELEVARLRSSFAAMSVEERQDPAWRKQVAAVLSQLVLFRMAVAGEVGRDDGLSLSGQEN
ncbi:hypothetical protein ACO0LC_25145 [Undibacterium sp. JH2W]|uniref:hypothetical protein n=1 Tax=Undibacterium sp. JH2W TaxID=3413037 RepID=UPI003BEF952A